MTSRAHIEAVLLCAAGLFAGCSSGPLSALRFHNHDPVRRVDDRRPIKRPAERVTRDLTDDIEALARRPLLHALAVPEPVAAANVNSLGEVPDSSWFENRIGVRELAPEEIARGPAGEAPDSAGPWTVLEASRPDPTPRLIVQDARGDRYILKFDSPRAPELETGAEVVVQRLLWAAGYHVPDNAIVELARGDLIVAQDAEYGAEQLTDARLDLLLEHVAKTPDGQRFRALASKYLPGKPIGGYAMSGARADDVNDRVAHEHRRDVRGQRLFFAWLGQTDVKESNTLDMWVPSAQDPERGHVVHYLLDFGKALGAWAYDGQHEHDGWAPHFDYGYATASLVTFGLWERPWEGAHATSLRGVGRYEAEHFDPEGYSPANSYLPFMYADRFDAFWAAQIIARFRPEHVRQAVRAARYSDPLASAYLTRTILARRRKILAHAFAEVTPLAELRAEGEPRGVQLCARDLLIAHQLAAPRGTRYLLTAYDYDGRRLPWRRELTAVEGGELCASGLQLARGHEGYTMVVIDLVRGRRELAPVIVHLARRPRDGAVRVIGLQRR
jgi:hypothetical protein